MSKQEDTTVEDKAVEFDVMPGADRPDEDDAPALDLSFETIEQEVDEVAEAEEVVAANVKGFKSICTVRALGPVSMTKSIL